MESLEEKENTTKKAKKKRKEKENWVNTQWLMITRPVTSSALAEALMGSPGR